jgi:Phosphotransferase enzyme family
VRTPTSPDAETEHALGGGFVTKVVRVGNTVRRPAGPWTPSVHALLRWLEGAGFSQSPRVQGIDAWDREILTFIEGDSVGWSDWPPQLRSGDGIAQLGALLRRYHEAVRGFTPPEDAQWRNPLAPKTGEIVRHGDFSPFNTVWRDGKVVGVIDWDFAQPGAAISDLAYLAWSAVPLVPDAKVREHGFPELVDRAERIRQLCYGYGKHGPAEVVDEAIRIVGLEWEETQELAARRLEPWLTFASDGNLAAFAIEAAWIGDNRSLLLGEPQD